jgi:hypothetical protein
LVASDNKPVALWAVPRSISTAFERVFVERDDFEVLLPEIQLPLHAP